MAGFFICSHDARRIQMPVLATVFALIVAGAAPAVSADAELRDEGKIGEAIRNLGHEAFRVREKASKYLWSRGVDAQAVLEKAARSDDPETSCRATEILKKIRSGLLPGMPPEFVEFIRQYRQAGIRGKTIALTTLFAHGQPGMKVALSLLRHEPNEAIRSEIVTSLRGQIYAAAQRAIAEDDVESAQEWLAHGKNVADSVWIRSSAILAYSAGSLDGEIRKRTNAAKKTPGLAADLAYLYRARGDLQEAVTAAEHAENPALLKHLLQEAGNWKKLADLHAQAARPENIEWLGYAASYNRLAGNTNAFQSALVTIEALGKNRREDDWFAAEALLLNDRPEKALDLLLMTEKYAIAGEILRCQLRFEELLKLEERAEKESSPDLAHLRVLVETIGLKTFPKEEEEEEEEGDVGQIIRHDDQPPPNVSETFRLMEEGDVFLKKEAWLMAAERYEKALAASPFSPLPMYLYGWALENSGTLEKGKSFMARATRMPLADARLRLVLAREFAKRDMLKAANRQYDLIIRSAAFESWPLGEALRKYAITRALKQKRFDDATRYAERDRMRCLRQNATLHHPYGYLRRMCMVSGYRALSLISAGDMAGGKEQLALCITALPDEPAELFGEFTRIGQTAPAIRMFEKAFALLEKACREYPSVAFSHNNLAWLCARCRRRLDVGLAHAKQAVKLAPTSPQFLDTLAEVYFQMKRNRLAIEIMEKCVLLAPGDDYFRRQLQRFRARDPSTDPGAPPHSF